MSPSPPAGNGDTWRSDAAIDGHVLAMAGRRRGRRKPVAFVGWGNVGGARAIEQLREVEFEMAPLPHAVHILPDVLIAARQAPEPFESVVFSPLEQKTEDTSDDLTWWARALAAVRRNAD
jgi:hypothetical protein